MVAQRAQRRAIEASGRDYRDFMREVGKLGGRPRKVTSAPATPRLAELLWRSRSRDAYNPW